jgi:hypothetical protein
MAIGTAFSEWLVETKTGARVGVIAAIEHPDRQCLKNLVTIASHLDANELVLLQLSAFDIRRNALQVLAQNCDRLSVDPATITIEVQDPYDGHLTARWLQALKPTAFSFAVDLWRSPVELVLAFPVSTWLIDMAVCAEVSLHRVTASDDRWSDYLKHLVDSAKNRCATEVHATNVTTETERDLLVACGIGVMSGPFTSSLPTNPGHLLLQP